MRSSDKRSAFSDDFLRQAHEQDQPATTALEASFSGPWIVEKRNDGLFGVCNAGSANSGHLAFFFQEETARLAAAVLPTLGRDPLFLVHPEAQKDGFPIQAGFGDRGGSVCGFCREFAPDLALALHVAEFLLRSPSSLAQVLRAASAAALEQAGRLAVAVDRAH